MGVDMYCHLGRIGSCLSDRIVISTVQNSSTGKEEFRPRIANSWWDWVLRIVSWIYSPASYTNENRKSIQCFRKMIEPIGEERLKRICNRYNIDLEKMEKEGSPLLSRTIAKIAVGVSDVDTVEMQRVIDLAHNQPSKLPSYISHPPFEKLTSAEKGRFEEELQKIEKFLKKTEAQFKTLEIRKKWPHETTREFETMIHEILAQIGKVQKISGRLSENISEKQKALFAKQLETAKTLFNKAKAELRHGNFRKSVPMTILDRFETLVNDGYIQILKVRQKMNSTQLLKTLQKVQCANELSPKDFAELYDTLALPAKSFQLPEMPELNGSAPSEFLARFVPDQFLADRERLGLQAEHPRSPLEAVIHNICVRGMRRKMEVGMLIPAPNHSEEKHRQFWRVAAILVTGEGNVSILVDPATKGTDLEPIRFFRGTSTTPSEVDAFSSIITDLEPHIGTTAHKSGEPYEPVIKKYLPKTKKVAGHSLGSTLAQIATAKDPEIDEGWYWAGPGVADKYIEKFNDRMSQPDADPVTLRVRGAGLDDLSVMGSCHLGYKAPQKVKIDFRFYSAMKKTGRLGVHTMMWNDQKFYGMAGGHKRAEIDRYLNHKSLVSLEWLRKAVGPYLVKILRLIRDFLRYMLQPKTLAIRGLQMGLYDQGQWKVYHIRPHQTSKAMANLERYNVATRKQKMTQSVSKKGY